MLEKELPNPNTTEVSLNLTSSVGAVWPPKEASFDRIKGFYTKEIINDKDTLVGFLNEFGRFIEVDSLNPESKTTRFTERLFVSMDTLRETMPVIISAEAVVPLKGVGGDFDDTAILYLGYNKDQRQSNPDEVKDNFWRLSEVLKKEPKTFSQVKRRMEEAGIEIKPLTHEERFDDQKTFDQMLSLYNYFGWNAEEVAELLHGKSNTIVVARHNGRIVSTGMAEKATLNVGGRNFHMAEITEAGTLIDYLGKGIYTGIAGFLMEHLVEEGTDLAYGECNANNIGVLHAARATGRTFSYEVSKEEGWDYIPNHQYQTAVRCQGYLRQHAPISGTPHVNEFNDLFPAFITRQGMIDYIRT